MTFPLALAAFAGLVSAAMFAVMSTGHPLSSFAVFFTALPLFAVGLSRGSLSALVAVLAGAVAIALIARFELAIAFVLAFALPATFLANRALLARPGPSGALEWYPLGRLALTLAALALAIFGGALLVASLGREEGAGSVVDMFGIGAIAEDPMLAGRIPPGALEALMVALPGMGAAFWMIMMTVNGVLAQAVLARHGWNRRPRGDFAGLHVGPWLAVPGAIGALLWWQGGGNPRLVGALIALVVGVVYLYQGLAVVHVLSWRWRWRTATLVGVYVGLVIVGQFVAPLVMLLGLSESWLRLRERLAPARPGGKEE